jgi:putative sugar O-methyltransferase
MLNHYRQSPALYQPSPFWEELNVSHIQVLQAWGLENFKRNIATKYFNWRMLGILAHQFLPVAIHWLRRPDLSSLQTSFPVYARPKGPGVSSLNHLEAWFYKLYTAMLAHYVAQEDRWNLLGKIEEPELGNPWRIHWKGHWISQDLCNSIFEFYSINETDRHLTDQVDFAELGAGYGRLAYVTLKALPQATYTIIDIPPALYVSQEYLCRLFPDEHVFTFRPFQRYEDVQQEFEAARIRFLMAHQIEMLPDQQFDTFITISTLHEMTHEQISGYIIQMSRLTRHYAFIKQWLKSRASAQNGFVIKDGEYPIPEHWSLVWHRKHPIQSWFFDALYNLGN